MQVDLGKRLGHGSLLSLVDSGPERSFQGRHSDPHRLPGLRPGLTEPALQAEPGIAGAAKHTVAIPGRTICRVTTEGVPYSALLS
jgi:hypothetical protein